ncbi:hypothetical protein NQ315_004444, partial [Exocentrus adspersus]
MAVNVDSTEIFSNLSSKIGNLLFGRREGDWTLLSNTLDELNSINYRYTVVRNPTKAVLLINQCCSFIPCDDDILVRKFSKLLYSLVKGQNIAVEGRTLTVLVQWLLNGLKIKDSDVVLVVLQALEAVLRSNTDNLAPLAANTTKEVCDLINNKKVECPTEILLLSLQCLEACTSVPSDFKSKDREGFNLHFGLCAKTFMHYLNKSPINFDDILHSKVLKVCLSGIQNVIIQDPVYLTQELGSILGVIKTFMLYGIKGVDFLAPQKILPSTLS